LHLAAADDRGIHHAVLISVMQRISWYAEDFLELLESAWRGRSLPQVLREAATDEERSLWERSLAVCADYFGTTSSEYRLLRYGITVPEVAEALSISESLVYRLKDEGKLRCFRIGKGAIRFREEDVMEYIDSCVVEVQVRPRRAVLPQLKHIRL
jgi:excisionase family DNA binding protein